MVWLFYFRHTFYFQFTLKSIRKHTATTRKDEKQKVTFERIKKQQMNYSQG